MRQSSREDQAGGSAGPDTCDSDAEGMPEDEGSASEKGGRSRLRAKVLPSLWGGKADADTVDIVVYVVTGRHGIIPIPEAFCRECHMFTRRADMAAEEVDVDVNVSVRSWWTHFPWALRHGGYHAPVMIVGGKRLCQGHDVPTTDEVVAAIERSVARKDK